MTIEEAVEKQIVIPPSIPDDRGRIYCMKCGCMVSKMHYYCSHCGQKLREVK